MLILLVLCPFLVAGSQDFQPLIVNGTNVAPAEIPYIVSLQLYGIHNCGGSILDETHILTAAHCVYKRESIPMTIKYGIIDLKDSHNIIKVTEMESHEEFSPEDSTENDIAVLTLAEPIQYSEFAQPTVLPEQDEPTPEGAAAVLAGWGLDESDGVGQKFLQSVNLKIYSDADCESMYSGSVNPTNSKYHICSGVDEGGKGQCTGDSGGPLYANGKQVGVVSFSRKPCMNKESPGVSTKVSSYVDWIKKKMRLKKMC